MITRLQDRNHQRAGKLLDPIYMSVQEPEFRACRERFGLEHGQYPGLRTSGQASHMRTVMLLTLLVVLGVFRRDFGLTGVRMMMSVQQ